MGGGETFYDLLGVDSDANEEAIDRAYRRRVKEYHPDVNDDPNARERFKRINQARDVLGDRKERARYDRLGHETYLARQAGGTTERDASATRGSAGAAANTGGRGDAGTGGRGRGSSHSSRAGRSSSDSGSSGGTTRSGTGAADRTGTGGSERETSDRSSGRSRASSTGGQSRSTGAADAGSTGGRAAGATEAGGHGSGGSTTGSDSTAGGRSATAGADPGGPRAARSPRGHPGSRDEQESTGEEPRTPGRFAVGEAVAGVGLAVVAAGAITLAVAVGGVVPVAGGGETLLVVAWLVVATVAGTLAARSEGWLPDEVVRAHAFPLVLFVGAWYVSLGTDYGAVAVALVAYAAHASLFRTAALVAGDERSVARSAVVWYVGSVPAAVLVYATRLDPGGGGLAGGTVVGTATSASAALGGALFLAVAVPVAVGVAHALWQFRRILH